MKLGEYDVSASDKVVWIHDEDGQCVGRFGKYAGEILTKHGYTICIKHSPWEQWKRDVEEEFKIKIPEEMKPE